MGRSWTLRSRRAEKKGTTKDILYPLVTTFAIADVFLPGKFLPHI
jgi:hypothetical protein